MHCRIGFGLALLGFAAACGSRTIAADTLPETLDGGSLDGGSAVADAASDGGDAANDGGDAASEGGDAATEEADGASDAGNGNDGAQ